MTAALQSIRDVDQLEDLLSQPTEAVVAAMRTLPGDILLLGAGGKIGPSLARMAKRASDEAGVGRRVIAVSRFSNAEEERRLQTAGVETIRCDLLDERAVAQLPDAPNLIYLAGLKFGSGTRPARTWAMNTYLPTIICRKYPASRIVAFSTGAVYGMCPVASGGSVETDLPRPVGEYAMSCLGRERMFEYFSDLQGTPVVSIRLFYASEMRYGVLVDLAQMIAAGRPIALEMGHFNIIWQGDANAMTLRAFETATSPASVLNVTGLELLSIHQVAEMLGERLGKAPVFTGTEQPTTCIGNASRAHAQFGSPRVTSAQLIEWTADWVGAGGVSHGKPTHFEVRDGIY